MNSNKLQAFTDLFDAIKRSPAEEQTSVLEQGDVLRKYNPVDDYRFYKTNTFLKAYKLV